MFRPYTYFSERQEQLPTQGLYRCSGLHNLEEVLANTTRIELPALVVEDAADGTLKLLDCLHNKQHHSLYVLVQADALNDQSREAAYHEAFTHGLAIFQHMYAEKDTTGYALSGIQADEISYFRVGPLVNSCYGYCFGYVVE